MEISNSLAVLLLLMISGATAAIQFMPVLQESWPSNGDLRLTGNGSTEDAGRLEIYLEPDSDYGDIEGQWGTVCGRKFRTKEAHVACRQLGFASASFWNFSIWTEFGVPNDSVPITLNRLRCTSKHLLHVLRCKHNTIEYLMDSDCEHDQDVAIYCNPKRLWDNPYRGQVRLVDNGTYTPSFGRVEVHQGKHWGTVCGKNFGVGAASSACRQLGYTGAAAVGGAPSPGSGAIWVGEVTCNKSKSCFTSCFKAHKPTYACNHSGDVAVKCTFNIDEAKVRSAGSRSKCKIKGFPISFPILIVSIVLSGILILGVAVTTIILFLCCCRKKCLPRCCPKAYYEQL